LDEIQTGSRVPHLHLRPDLRIALVVMAAFSILAFDAVTPLGLAVWFFQVVLVWVSTYWASRRQIAGISLLCGLCVIAGFILSPVEGRATWVDWTNLSFGLVVIAALAHACVRQRAAEDEVRVLSGLLPICAWCRKIRNETGGWEQFEVYVQKHSHAEFSHGICEECSVRMRKEI
jgi:hypothetical protein